MSTTRIDMLRAMFFLLLSLVVGGGVAIPASGVAGVDDSRLAVGAYLEDYARLRGFSVVASAGAYKALSDVKDGNFGRVGLSEKVVGRWVVLYVSPSDMSAVESDHAANVGVWHLVFAQDKVLSSVMETSLTSYGVEWGLIAQGMTSLCGVRVALSATAERTPLMAVDRGRVSPSDLCNDYMLLLAASGVRLEKREERLVGAAH